MKLTIDDLRFSRHRGLYAWLLLLGAVAALMIIATLLHAGHNGPAFPNRVDTESDSAGSPAQNSGYGDVGDTRTDEARRRP